MARRNANGNGHGALRTRPQRRLTQSELDGFLAKAADLLRGGVDHSEFRGANSSAPPSQPVHVLQDPERLDLPSPHGTESQATEPAGRRHAMSRSFLV